MTIHWTPWGIAVVAEALKTIPIPLNVFGSWLVSKYIPYRQVRFLSEVANWSGKSICHTKDLDVHERTLESCRRNISQLKVWSCAIVLVPDKDMHSKDLPRKRFSCNETEALGVRTCTISLLYTIIRNHWNPTRNRWIRSSRNEYIPNLPHCVTDTSRVLGRWATCVSWRFVSMSGPCNWILGHQCIPHLLACCGHHKLLQHRHDAVIVLHEILQVVDANSTFPGASLPRSCFMIFLCPSSVICWYDWSAWPLPAFSMTPAITAIEVMASSLTWFLKKWKRCSSPSVKTPIFSGRCWMRHNCCSWFPLEAQSSSG